MDKTEKVLEDTSGRYAKPYRMAVHDLFVARATGDRMLARSARQRMGEALRQSMAMAEIMGAERALRKTAKAVGELREDNQEFMQLRRDRGMLRFAAEDDQVILPDVTFNEALEDLVSRTPVTIRDAAERTAARISQLYSEDRMVAFVRSSEDSVTEAARAFIARAIRDGDANPGAGLSMAVEKVREESEPWAESYSRMAFRTNFNTAATAGRFRQVRDPAIRRVLPAFQFMSAGDGDVRDNHDPMDGKILAVDNRAWNRIAPPLGYNCRCTVLEKTLPELQRMGRVNPDGSIREDKIPPGVFPDPGFRYKGRPDLFLEG